MSTEEAERIGPSGIGDWIKSKGLTQVAKIGAHFVPFTGNDTVIGRPQAMYNPILSQ